MSTLKIIRNITYRINATSSLHSTVINSLNNVLQAMRTIIQCEMPFVTAYSKAPGTSCTDFFFCQQWVIVLIRKRVKSSFLIYHNWNYFSNQILKTEEIHSYDEGPF